MGQPITQKNLNTDPVASSNNNSGLNPGGDSTTDVTANVTQPDHAAIASSVKKNVNAAGAALHKGIDKVTDPARSTVERISSVAHEAVDKLAESATGAAERFSGQTRFVSEAPNRALNFSRSWVQDKPLEAIGAALALGFILGRLTGR